MISDHQSWRESAAWRTLKKALMKERPVCEFCNRAPSTTVHHVVRPVNGGAPLAIDNLRASCLPCHRVETARQRQIFGRL